MVGPETVVEPLEGSLVLSSVFTLKSGLHWKVLVCSRSAGEGHGSVSDSI